MATLQSSSASTPHHTFLEKKPPLMPRQSTSDVLSFTHIIANRLSPGQTVWEFFSPLPSTSSPRTSTSVAPTGVSSAVSNTATAITAPLGCASPPVSPTSSNFSPPSPATTPATETPPATATTTATAPAPAAYSKATNRRSLLFFGSLTKSSPALDIQESKNDNNSNNAQDAQNGPLSPVSPTGPSPPMAENTQTTTTSTTSTAPEPTPKAQKRKSFAQSLRNMLSLSSLLSSSNASKNSPPPSATPPHYNILVLGSDSAPLASTLYKMSGVLPGASKIGHYQEISGFFVAYFKSDGSFSCSPRVTSESERNPPTVTSTTTVADATAAEGRNSVDSKMAEEVAALVEKRASEVQSDEIKRRRRSSGEYAGAHEGEDDDVPRSSTESISTLVIDGSPPLASSACSSTDDLSLKSTSTVTQSLSTTAVPVPFGGDSLHRVETLVDEDEQSTTAPKDAGGAEEKKPAAADQAPATTPAPQDNLNPSANASLSIHAFSLDTTWPVPRILAQTFWFPHAHGIIYVVDATRKNDPRGIDHLLHARQFLASLVLDPFFKRKDIPVVVFANKAGLDEETCYRVDEIADILGCEEWDEANPCPHGLNGDDAAGEEGRSSTPPPAPSSKGAAAAVAARPWCVKSTRADGSGDGLRESVEWLKSRMGEVWKS